MSAIEQLQPSRGYSEHEWEDILTGRRTQAEIDVELGREPQGDPAEVIELSKLREARELGRVAHPAKVSEVH